jgi:C4-dicarboxylate-binding protein DctP
MRLSRRAFAAAAASALAAPFVVHAQQTYKLRCSLDTAPSHGRNISIKDYLGKVQQASGGRVEWQLFESGSLFPDLQIGKALIENQVEMACPGSWTITGIIPDADFFQLPPMYGQSLELTHKIIDGPAGALLDKEIAGKLRAHVVGPWLDLGFQNWYSTSKPIKSLADLRGLKIRNPGGAGQSWRARYLGAIPNTTAWPNVPLALSQGTFDALVSTNESLASAKLWEAGIKYGLEDHQYIGEYIPMIRGNFWNELPPDLQKTFTETWAQNIPTYRANMAAAQTHARQTLESHGVQFFDPTPQQIAADRNKMLPFTEQEAKEIHVSPEMAKLVTAAAGESS